MKNRPLLCTLGVAIALLAPPVSAQAPSSKAAPVESDALTDKARQLYEEGSKAAAAGRWADAHASFLAAWKLKEHYQIASNLGVAELKLGKYRDAAEHLTWYLREAPTTKVQERQRGAASLKEALAKVASITVKVVPQGAEVTVDGATVERAPTVLQVFLDPGEHEIGAKLDGHVPAKRAVAAKAGGTETVELRLEMTPAAPVAVQGSGAALPAPDAGAEARETTRTAVLVGGGVAAGVGFAAGVVFTVLANGKASDARALWGEVDKQGRSVDCSDADAPAPCEELIHARDTQGVFNGAAFFSFVGAGAVGVGTLVYGLVTRRPSEPERRVQITPLVGPGSVGISLAGAL